MLLIGETAHLAFDRSLTQGAAQSDQRSIEALQSLAAVAEETTAAAAPSPPHDLLAQTFQYVNPPLAQLIKRLEVVLLSSPWEARGGGGGREKKLRNRRPNQ